MIPAYNILEAVIRYQEKAALYYRLSVFYRAEGHYWSRAEAIRCQEIARAYTIAVQQEMRSWYTTCAP